MIKFPEVEVKEDPSQRERFKRDAVRELGSILDGLKYHAVTEKNLLFTLAWIRSTIDSLFYPHKLIADIDVSAGGTHTDIKVWLNPDVITQLNEHDTEILNKILDEWGHVIKGKKENDDVVQKEEGN